MVRHRTCMILYLVSRKPKYTTAEQTISTIHEYGFDPTKKQIRQLNN